MHFFTRIPTRYETERLYLRPFKRRDAAQLPELLDDWQVARWLARAPHPYTAEDGRGWVRISRRVLRREKGLPLAILRKRDDVLVGGVGLSFETGEIGYWFGQQHWGNGYATEVVSLMTGVGFVEAELPNLWAAVLPGNNASCRVLEKVGYRQRGTRPYPFRSVEREALFYQLQDWEWQSAA